jgi:hypothetical protein
LSEINSQNLEAIISAVVQKVLAERQSTSLAQPSTPSAGKILVGVCCGECLNTHAQSALEALRHGNFALHQPEESTFKKLADREKLVAESDGVLLPSLGDDDAAKMAMGIFDEPVTRLALTALASDKPVWAAIQSPYDEAIKRRAPQLHRVWEGHKKLLESYGIQVVEYSQLASTVKKALTPSAASAASTPLPRAGEGPGVRAKKVLITVKEVEAAAKDGASLRLPLGAIVTPLARDRARELDIKIY